MGRVIDITEKLDFESNPKIKIKGKEYEVNADAETVLKIMGLLGDGESVKPKDVAEMYNLLFSAKERKEIAKLNLQLNDFQVLVEAAIGLITDSEENKQGE
ncbi:MAG: hypothetical protein IJZ53_07610 [Tyzzerella sp.]|nr:hypothetical protein [Tyzzerella sp.]